MPRSEMFFGEQWRAELTISLLDGLAVIGQYFDAVEPYDEEVKNEAAKLLGTSPLLRIGTSEEHRLAVLQFYNEKVIDLYEALKETYKRLVKFLLYSFIKE